MNTLRTTLVLVLALALVATAGAQLPSPVPQPAPADDPIARVLFPPELVMQNQQAIGLRAEQRAAITKAIQEFQNKVVELQWRMQDQQQRLAAMLEKPSIDQAAALAQVDELLTVEREVKRAHLALLIQIKNTLTPDQQARLIAQREGAGGAARRPD